jgi:PAS domain S-box-containing protein
MAEERYRLLVEATLEGVAIHDRGTIVDANPALARMFGYAPEELIGRNVLELAARESRDPVMAHVRSGSEEPYEATGLRKDGSTFVGELRGRAIVYEDRPARIVSVRDVTDRRRAQDERERALATREEFLSIASHELNSPLTSLKLQLQEVQRLTAGGALPSRERLERMLSVADRQVNRLTRLVFDVLDVTRFTTGQLQLELEPVDLADVAREAIERLADQVTLQRCRIDLSAPAPVEGRWDRLRLEQVTANLLSNALKYGAGNPITIGVERAGDRARLTMQDRGPGIPPEAQARIFERFERAEQRRTGGLGLGLYIVRQLVTAHGGEVRVDSTPGHGATFTVELPIR